LHSVSSVFSCSETAYCAPKSDEDKDEGENESKDENRNENGNEKGDGGKSAGNWSGGRETRVRFGPGRERGLKVGPPPCMMGRLNSDGPVMPDLPAIHDGPAIAVGRRKAG